MGDRDELKALIGAWEAGYAAAAPFIVARMKDGEPFDFLHEVSADGARHMVCTNRIGAKRFATLEAAADAAGACMDRQPGEEYSALRA